MNGQIEYFVDGKEFASKESELTVADILGKANKSADLFYLVSIEDKAEYKDPKQRIVLKAGERFETRKRGESRPDRPVTTIHYKVNGEPQETQEPVLTVETILRKAGSVAGIDVKEIGNYSLEYADKDQKYTDLGAKITIEEGDEFLAIHIGKTPVA